MDEKVEPEKSSLIVKVTVTSKAGEVISEWTMDYLRTVGKKRIAKCAYWALVNGHSMLTEPVE